MSIVLIIAIVLVVMGNIVAIYRTTRAPDPFPDALFLIVDGAIILYVFSAYMGGR